MENFHPTRHQYQSPQQLHHEQNNTNVTLEQTTNLQKLQERLRASQIVNTPLVEAPQRELKHKTYAHAVVKQHPTTHKKQHEDSTTNEIQELKKEIEKQNHDIKQITTQTRTVATSSLTPGTIVTEGIKQITEQQNKQFRKMMHEMMQSVFQQMFALIQTVLNPRPETHGGIRYLEYPNQAHPTQHPAPYKIPTPLMTPPPRNIGKHQNIPTLHPPNHQSTVVGTA